VDIVAIPQPVGQPKSGTRPAGGREFFEKYLNTSLPAAVNTDERGGMMIGLSREMTFPEPASAKQQEALCEERFAALVCRQSRFAFRVAYSVLRNVHDA
jgi:hypothetical protein